MPASTEVLAQGAINVTDLIGKLAGLGAKALPAARIFFDFVPVPWAGAVVDALTIAAPYLNGVATAAPIIDQAITDGVPVIDALRAQGPKLLLDFKALYAVAVNHDPARPETLMTAADVTDEQAGSFAGSIFSRSFFSPQDPRFDRGMGNQST